MAVVSVMFVRRIAAAAAVVIAGTSIMPARAVAGAPLSGLELPPGARAAAMGVVTPAALGDPQVVRLNPALVAFTRGVVFASTYENWRGDVDFYENTLAGGYALRDGRLTLGGALSHERLDFKFYDPASGYPFAEHSAWMSAAGAMGWTAGRWRGAWGLALRWDAANLDERTNADVGVAAWTEGGAGADNGAALGDGTPSRSTPPSGWRWRAGLGASAIGLGSHSLGSLDRGLFAAGGPGGGFTTAAAGNRGLAGASLGLARVRAARDVAGLTIDAALLDRGLDGGVDGTALGGEIAVRHTVFVRGGWSHDVLRDEDAASVGGGVHARFSDVSFQVDYCYLATTDSVRRAHVFTLALGAE